MRRNRIYLICLAIVIVAGFFFARSEAFPDAQDQGKNRMEGQLFVVRLVPAARRLDVLVTGNKVADVDISKVGLTARLKMGDRTIVIPASRKGDRFRLESLPTRTHNATLELRVNQDEKVENFEFQLPPTRP